MQKAKATFTESRLFFVFNVRVFCQQKEEGKVQGQLNHTDSSQYIRDLKSQIAELEHEVRHVNQIVLIWHFRRFHYVHADMILLWSYLVTKSVNYTQRLPVWSWHCRRSSDPFTDCNLQIFLHKRVTCNANVNMTTEDFMMSWGWFYVFS